MASKRIAKSSINWMDFNSRIPEHQRQLYHAFKARCDNYMKSVLSYPENPPAIDWDYYKKKIPHPDLVDKFKQEYTALIIPYPPFPDSVTQEINAQENDAKHQIESFKIESDKRIFDHKQELTRLQTLLQFDQMTLEDFRDAYPHLALDPINHPTFWPHNAEEQPGYEEAEVEESEEKKKKKK